MSKNDLEVELHYENKDFNELMKKLVFRKISESTRNNETKNTEYNQIAIHHKDSRR